LTGLAALPAALVFGALYQGLGAAIAMTVSAVAVMAATAGWAVVAPKGKNGEART
jgi:hypothetical protein